MQKNNTTKNTIVKFEDNEICNVMIDDNLKFIPNFGWSIWNKVLNKVKSIGGLNAVRDSMCHTSREYVSSNRTKEYKYELINSISESKGTTYKYSKKQHPKQKYKKVIFSNGRKIVPIYDNGKYGVTEGGIYIIVKTNDEGEKIVNYLKSDLVRFLIKTTKWSNFETIKQIFWSIANPKEIEDATKNNDINKYFELDNDEIRMITNK
jgi:bifunctional DNA-binding transcriptional regulator/antitoxin component of YhaV-PrlF toxin-antitoxin module